MPVATRTASKPSRPQRFEVVDRRVRDDLDAECRTFCDVLLDDLRRQPVGGDREAQEPAGSGAASKILTL